MRKRAALMAERKRTRCDVYSRVAGYLSPTSQWNKGKREEFKDRVTFAIPADIQNGEAPA